MLKLQTHLLKLKCFCIYFSYKYYNNLQKLLPIKTMQSDGKYNKNSYLLKQRLLKSKLFKNNLHKIYVLLEAYKLHIIQLTLRVYERKSLNNKKYQLNLQYDML